MQSQAIFERESVEFVTVAAEYCRFLESAEADSRDTFVDTAAKLLPLLYVKALLLPDMEAGEDGRFLEASVTEESYTRMREHLAVILGDRDDYLDVFLDDMKYSDRPITRYVSEELADIYQDVANFIRLFQTGDNATMHDALAQCQENFRLYWGRKVVNVLRALHDIRFEPNEP